MEKRKYRYKLYPNAKQSEILLAHLRLHQQLYHAALQGRINCYQKTGQTMTYNEQQASLTQIRKDLLEYKAIAYTSERMTLRRLDKALKRFFKRLKKSEKPGFPRFKSLKQFSSFEMLDTKFIPNESWKHGKLFIQDIGHIKASQVKYQHGQWWLSLTIECEPLRNCKQQKAGGLDWGVAYLASITEDDGTAHQIENSRYDQNSKNTLRPLEQAKEGFTTLASSL